MGGDGHGIFLDVTAPSSGGSCSIQKDTVAVSTHSGTGYTLTVSDSSTDSRLTSGSNHIANSSGTVASPVPLSNSWGFRVDGLSGFGSGPTSPQSNVATSSIGFAGMPASTDTPSTLASTTSYSASTVNTDVWYGVCADTSIPSGTYSTNILYTAVVNP